MTTNQTTHPSVFLDAAAVLDGPLPVEISMEPILQGAPFAYERVLYDAAGSFFAVWACDAGVYPRVKDKRGSFMYIISGEATITDEDGTSHELTAGSVIVLPYGWVGAWDIRETIRKVYLHTTPVPPYREGVQPSAFLAAVDVLEGDLQLPVAETGASWAPPVAETVVFDGPDGRCAVQERGPGVYRRAAAEGASYLYVISGEATIADEDGTSHELTAGSAVALPDGWAGTWDIRTTIRTVHVDTAPIADK
ncbi:cupin domain-containing protein [Micromonospora sp. NPDC048830]|uniref:cupin domain-containing protein n=1 Tax=Micromonospora sp. NPDC048830 TaxID=3364257 RepID=UPI003712F6A7